MDCPRDKCTLQPFRQGRYPRFECPMCTGMYVAERDLMQTLGYKDDRKFEAVAKVKVANVKDSALVCPLDGTTLKALKYLSTELDVCPQCHGLWLDYGEMEKLFRRLDDEVVKGRGERQRQVKIEEVDAPSALGEGGVDDVLTFLGGTIDWTRLWKKIL
jgi:Zn-finger nucleic acid-binding protein